jgi:hypothetical protein
LDDQPLAVSLQMDFDRITCLGVSNGIDGLLDRQDLDVIELDHAVAWC